MLLIFAELPLRHIITILPLSFSPPDAVIFLRCHAAIATL